MSPAEVQALGDKIRAAVADKGGEPDPKDVLELLLGVAVNIARIADGFGSAPDA